MDEHYLEQHLWRVIEDDIVRAEAGGTPDVGIADVQTFDEADITTSAHGLVIRMRNGSEYQLPIVRSE
jgi:hypothetical protein